MARKKKRIEIATPEEVDEYVRSEASDEPETKPTEEAVAPESEPDTKPQSESEAEREPETDLQRAERERDEFKDKWLRGQAEAQNQARRLRTDCQEEVRYAVAGFARSLLNVVDDLERSLDAAQDSADDGTARSGADAVAEGVRIVYNHLLKTLTEHHVERIEAVGQPFDPACHEALTQMPSADHPAGTVLEEVQKGYRLHERVLRPARVIISSAPSEPASAEEGETEQGEEASGDNKE